MAYAVSFLGLVALVQGAAWLAAATRAAEPSRGLVLRGRVGMLLAPAGLLLFALGVLSALIPGFWS
jgi:hypothetical protein